jgi:glutamate dehydrogenase/leucine dehydrogenase
VHDLSKEYKVTMRVAAYIAALRRISVAMKYRGMY